MCDIDKNTVIANAGNLFRKSIPVAFRRDTMPTEATAEPITVKYLHARRACPTTTSVGNVFDSLCAGSSKASFQDAALLTIPVGVSLPQSSALLTDHGCPTMGHPHWTPQLHSLGLRCPRKDRSISQKIHCKILPLLMGDLKKSLAITRRKEAHGTIRKLYKQRVENESY